MGLFDFLFGSKKRTNVQIVPDHIWMTTGAKFAGVAKEAEERSKSETVAILLVSHFSDVLARLQELTNQRTFGVPCMAVLASSLDANLAASLNLDESAMIDILVAERHPLPSVDDRLGEFADELNCRCRFSHHVSLEDAVMKVFGGDWLRNVLKQMGMKDDEAIESQMISRRIRRAQQRIEGRAIGSPDADSAAEWLEKNYSKLASK
jgi:hypothetical protein